MGTVINIKPEEVAGMIRARTISVRRALVRGCDRAALRSQAVMAKRTPTDQGQLKGSWRVHLGALDTSGAVVELAALINDAPHAGIVELGARPHKVSPEGWAAIYAWVVRHRHLFGFVTKSGRTKAHKPKIGQVFGKVDVVPELAGITWGIVKRIEKEGQKPTFVVRDSLPVLEAILKAEVDKQIARVASEKGKT